MISLTPSAVRFSGEQKLKRKPSAPHFRPSKQELAEMSAGELQTEKINAERQREYHLKMDEGDRYENRQERASAWDMNAQVLHAQQRKNADANFDKIKQKRGHIRALYLLEHFKELLNQTSEVETASEEKGEKQATVEKAAE